MTKAIYVITNVINGKQYVGQTIHPEKRWWEHKYKARMHLDEYPIHLAINKYGEDNFTFDILKWTEDYDNEEIATIDSLNTLIPNGYNISTGGNGNVMYGEDHPRNTISDVDVNNIIDDLRNNKLSDRAIAQKYNTTDKIVADINHGYAHKRNNMNYPIRKKLGLQKLSKQDVDEIIDKLLNTALSYNDLANEYNVSKGAIYHINKGLTFRNNKYNYPIRSNTINEA